MFVGFGLPGTAISMSYLMEQKWLEMIQSFLKLTPEERAAESEKRLDETRERMARIYNISLKLSTHLTTGFAYPVITCFLSAYNKFASPLNPSTT